ncbi:hypothetical protein CLAFUW4_04136 [Fulvia fulva]|uniref:Uncharacterized protein n=1 Tax=Passalora fulva TaxID=5499 RepID=A0A9Q8P7Q0_PASFU|nr:uncharacterized protein CLAFUR5_04098 [Fulvia fulva]KAK4626487.1 hypothetical protein CLAFUR4_04122 [Fulvia fulva]KAK4628264.1 hypothetical protein CLAFUR0_04123 [Fulvia fulva]UJO16258.1 hypothetical protein CLAFUR5_04098 [Fulvia fulva]WPV14069.1 hypothetical protein CLAFUW4_04136 [Fulvia fulva]WPV28508.1 hypothetical protein CLAFUW7_04125 [Fulvia fulva]
MGGGERGQKEAKESTNKLESDRFSSHYFNLVVDDTTSTATATSTPIGAIGTASSLPDPTATSASTTTSTPTPDGGLSTGAKAGIGVGVALGVLAIIAAAAAFWFMKRRKGAKYAPARSNPDSPPPGAKYNMPMEQRHGQPAPSWNAYDPSSRGGEYGGPVYAQDAKGFNNGMGPGPAEMAATQAAPVEMSAESALGPRELESNPGSGRR